MHSRIRADRCNTDAFLRRLGGRIRRRFGQNAVSHFAHGHAVVHCGSLNPFEGLRLGHAVGRHQHAFRPLDGLSGLQPFVQRGDLGLQRGHLGEPGERDLDSRHEVALLERLDQVGHRTGGPGPLDELALAERGQDDHRGDPGSRDLLRRGETVHDRHLDVEDDQIGPQVLGQPDRRLTVRGLADDVVALFDEHLAQIQTDERLVFRDQHPTGRYVSHSRLSDRTSTYRRPVTANISVVGTLWGPKRPRIPTGRGTELKPPTVWVRIPPGARRTSQTVAAGATAPAATFSFCAVPRVRRFNALVTERTRRRGGMLVWYTAYGSNMHADRLRYYLLGGHPP